MKEDKSYFVIMLKLNCLNNILKKMYRFFLKQNNLIISIEKEIFYIYIYYKIHLTIKK